MTELNDDQRAIAEECDAVKAMLLEKNKNYGNSALDPVRIFSKADAVEQILVRLDDKLSRLKRGSEAGEDITFDIIGYLVLLRIAQRRNAQPDPVLALGERVTWSSRLGTKEEGEVIGFPKPGKATVRTLDGKLEFSAPIDEFKGTKDPTDTILEFRHVPFEANEAKHPGDLPLPPVQTVHILMPNAMAACGVKPGVAGATTDPPAATCIECKRVYEERRGEPTCRSCGAPLRAADVRDERDKCEDCREGTAK